MASLMLKFLKSSNSLILLLISILGFSTSCKKEEQPRMYGSPYARYTINGKIVSAKDKQAIPEIIVEMRFVAPVSQEEQPYRLVATNYSREDGSFRLTQNSFDYLTYELKFIDTDGPLNGQYEPLDTTIVFKDPVFTGGDGQWYAGETEKEVTIELKPKQ